MPFFKEVTDILGGLLPCQIAICLASFYNKICYMNTHNIGYDVVGELITDMHNARCTENSPRIEDWEFEEKLIQARKFSKIFPKLTQEEQNYLLALPVLGVNGKINQLLSAWLY